MLDIKKYYEQEKENLKKSVHDQGWDKYIKLGIIDATQDPEPEEDITKEFESMGWPAEVFRVLPGEPTCNTAIIRALDHGCSAILVNLNIRDGVKLIADRVPRAVDCASLRADSLVLPIRTRGIIDYLNDCGAINKRKHAVVIRDSHCSEKYVEALMGRGMTVSVCSEWTDPSLLSGLICDANLIITDIGRENMICRGQCWDAIVIDAGGGDFEERPDFDQDTAWSISDLDSLELLDKLALLKNVADITRMYYV